MSIKPKIGLCIDCTDGVPKPLIAGRCVARHYWPYTNKKSQDKRNAREKKPVDFKLVGKYHATELSLYFDKHVKLLKGICMNCGEPINKFDRLEAIAAVAHIFPKGLFDSVALNDFNQLELGPRCGCHSLFDSSWMAAAKMNVWPIAAQRIIIIKDSVADSERGKVYDLIVELAEKCINESRSNG